MLFQLASPPANDNKFRGFVYFMSVDGPPHPCVKIGVAINPKARRGDLQIGNHKIIRLDGYFDPMQWGIDPYEWERELHIVWAPYRMQGEWYGMPSDQEMTRLDKIVHAYFRYPYLYEQWYRLWHRRHG